MIDLLSMSIVNHLDEPMKHNQLIVGKRIFKTDQSHYYDEKYICIENILFKFEIMKNAKGEDRPIISFNKDLMSMTAFTD